jgi:hypothetical protein
LLRADRVASVPPMRADRTNFERQLCFRWLLVGALPLAIIVSAAVWSTSASSAASPSLRHECLSAALSRPTVTKQLRMIAPGIWARTGFPREQTIVGGLRFAALPEECGARYVRSAHGSTQMFNKGRWVTTAPTFARWNGIEGVEATWSAPPAGHWGSIGLTDNPKSAWTFNTCSNGQFHRVRILIVSALTRPALERREGTHEWFLPVVVQGSCKKAALSEQRVHKLQEKEFGSHF